MNDFKKEAEKISLTIPGHWPDEESQKKRIDFIESALREAYEKGIKAERTRCADIADRYMEIYGADGHMDLFDAAQVIRNLILIPVLKRPVGGEK